MFQIFISLANCKIDLKTNTTYSEFPGLAKPLFDGLAKIRIDATKNLSLFGYSLNSTLRYPGNFDIFSKQLTPYFLSHYLAGLPSLILFVITILLCLFFVMFCCCCCKPQHASRPKCASIFFWYISMAFYLFSLFFLIFGFFLYMSFRDNYKNVPKYVVEGANNTKAQFNNLITNKLIELGNKFVDQNFDSLYYMYSDSPTPQTIFELQLEKVQSAIDSLETNKNNAAVKPYYDWLSAAKGYLADTNLQAWLTSNKGKLGTTYSHIAPIRRRMDIIRKDILTDTVYPLLDYTMNTAANLTNSFDPSNSGAYYIILGIGGSAAALFISLILTVMQSCGFHGHSCFSRFIAVFGPAFGILWCAVVALYGISTAVVGASINDLCNLGSEFPTNYFNAYQPFNSTISGIYIYPLHKGVFQNGSLSIYEAFNLSQNIYTADFNQYAAPADTRLSSYVQGYATISPTNINSVSNYANWLATQEAEKAKIFGDQSSAALYLLEHGTAQEKAKFADFIEWGSYAALIQSHTKMNMFAGMVAQEGATPGYIAGLLNPIIPLIKEKIVAANDAPQSKTVDLLTVGPFAKTVTATCYETGGAYGFYAIFAFIYALVFICFLIIICARRKSFADKEEGSASSSSSGSSSDSTSSSSTYRRRRRARDSEI